MKSGTQTDQAGEPETQKQFEVFAVRKMAGKCALKLWNQKEGCFCWVFKPVSPDGPFLRKVA